MTVKKDGGKGLMRHGGRIVGIVFEYSGKWYWQFEIRERVGVSKRNYATYKHACDAARRAWNVRRKSRREKCR